MRSGQFPPPGPSARRASPLGGRILAESAATSPETEPVVPLAHVPAPTHLLPQVTAPKGRRVDRKMSLIRRSGLFSTDTRGAKISRAANEADLREAYKLVQRVYKGTGFIKSEDVGGRRYEDDAMRLRAFEFFGRAATFIAKKNGRVVGVLSIVHDSPLLGLPSDEAFADELAPLRARGKKLVEITNQAVDEEFRSSAVPTELMRCVLAHSLEAGIDAGIAAVSPSHHAFYELLGFVRIGHSRSYTEKVHDPVVPVQIDLDPHRHPKADMDEVERFMHSYLTAENPYFLYVQAWDNAARDYFHRPHVRPAMLRECSGEQLKALREQIEELSHRISGPMFVKPIPSAIPDLRDLGAPQGDSFCIPPHESSTAQVREVDEAVARDRCACELGLPESEVDRWKADEPTEEPPPPVGAKWKASATRRFRRMRDFLSVFRRHSVPRESQ